MDADEIGRILDELGERLGPAGARVFELAIRQVVIEGTANVLSGVVLVLVAVWAFKRARAWIFRPREAKNSYYSSTDEMDLYFPMGFVGAATGALFLWGMYNIYAGATALLNPEYAAIRDLLGRIR